MNNFILRLLIITVIQVLTYAYPLNDKEIDCVEKYNLNKTNVEMWNVQPIIPEENVEMLQFMSCYWKKLGYQNDNGEIDYVKLSEVVYNDLKKRFLSDCLHIVAFIVENCRKDINNDSDGLKVVKMWNCLNIYTENLF
ncbi:hypothetical protein RN001_001644 [Aquatica leii]|uniref:Uncharacterized protein n=1 Tax=Aquatica leii TaxID=1421715 RepID=A0AAN7SQZ4_9COLE|nr:hypothetical protein RN001_001644 [Aquatica leii]